MAYSQTEHEFFTGRLFLSNQFFKPFKDEGDFLFGTIKPVVEPIRAACLCVGLLSNSLLMLLNSGLNFPSKLAENNELLNLFWVLAIVASINALPSLLAVYLGIVLIDNPEICSYFAMGLASLANVFVSPILNTLELMTRLPATLINASLSDFNRSSAAGLNDVASVFGASKK